jgi:hypothetical protein
MLREASDPNRFAGYLSLLLMVPLTLTLSGSLPGALDQACTVLSGVVVQVSLSSSASCWC